MTTQLCYTPEEIEAAGAEAARSFPPLPEDLKHRVAEILRHRPGQEVSR